MLGRVTSVMIRKVNIIESLLVGRSRFCVLVELWMDGTVVGLSRTALEVKNAGGDEKRGDALRAQFV